MGLASYRDLVVWQKAMDLIAGCYAFTRGLPKEELFGLTSQMRRAAVSIAANIAEGYGRPRQAYLNHISIAHGSLMELETHLLVSERVGYVPEGTIAPLLTRAAEVSRMLHGLRKSLGGDRPKP
jgi:four helix bundle protein